MEENKEIRVEERSNGMGMGPIIVGIVVIAAIGFLVWSQSKPPSPNSTDNTGAAGSVRNGFPYGFTLGTPTASSSVATFTFAEVQKHNTAASCYSVVDGNIYDLTTWISQHPGGPDKILNFLCGKDGTTAFHNKHDDAQKQKDIIATFKIGTLKQ